MNEPESTIEALTSPVIIYVIATSDEVDIEEMHFRGIVDLDLLHDVLTREFPQLVELPPGS